MGRCNSLTDHEKGMFDAFEKMGILKEKSPRKSTDQDVQWIIT